VLAFDRVRIHVHETDELDEIPTPEGDCSNESVFLELVCEGIERCLPDDDSKTTLSDLMRLLEAQREATEMEPGPMRAGWIQQCRESREE
jgi:hypothetical protein